MTTTTSKSKPAARPGSAAAPACPICGHPADPKFRPFCSRRCSDVDLSRWLNGVYRVSVDDPEAGMEEDEKSS
jgi:endogenous inhibitor of DNA gyrase (YacG/DUF329 family)